MVFSNSFLAPLHRNRYVLQNLLILFVFSPPVTRQGLPHARRSHSMYCTCASLSRASNLPQFIRPSRGEGENWDASPFRLELRRRPVKRAAHLEAPCRRCSFQEQVSWKYLDVSRMFWTRSNSEARLCRVPMRSAPSPASRWSDLSYRTRALLLGPPSLWWMHHPSPSITLCPNNGHLTRFPGSTPVSATEANSASADSGLMSFSLNTYEVL